MPSQTVIGLSALSKDLNYWRQEVQMLNFLNEKSVRLNLLGNGASCLSRSLTEIFRILDLFVPRVVGRVVGQDLQDGFRILACRSIESILRHIIPFLGFGS